MGIMFDDGIWQLCRADIEENWPVIEPLLEKPCARSNGRHTTAGLLTLICDGVYSLFVAICDHMIKSVAVVTLTEYSAGCWLTIISCGGDQMADWLAGGRQALENFARRHHCLGIEVFGRKGWCRAMELKPVGVWMERKL